MGSEFYTLHIWEPRTKSYFRKESPRSAVANVLDCDIVVSKFKLQRDYYVHFRTNT